MERESREAVEFSDIATTEIINFIKNIYPSIKEVKNAAIEYPIIIDLNRQAIIATNGHWIKTLEISIPPLGRIKNRYWGLEMVNAEKLLKASPKRLKSDDYLVLLPENGYAEIISEILYKRANRTEFIKIPTKVLKLILKRAKILKNVIKSGGIKITENTIQITVFDGLVRFFMSSQKGEFSETINVETNSHKIGYTTGLSIDYLEKLISTKENEIGLSLNPSAPCYLDLAKSQVVIMPVRLD